MLFLHDGMEWRGLELHPASGLSLAMPALIPLQHREKRISETRVAPPFLAEGRTDFRGFNHSDTAGQRSVKRFPAARAPGVLVTRQLPCPGFQILQAVNDRPPCTCSAHPGPRCPFHPDSAPIESSKPSADVLLCRSSCRGSSRDLMRNGCTSRKSSDVRHGTTKARQNHTDN
jgi:hypothetical protein